MLIRPATTKDLAQIKKIADANKQYLGFVTRPSLEFGIEKGWLWAAVEFNTVVGFANLWRRKDGYNTIMEICVAKEYRCQGIGQLLIMALPKPLRLKCTADNPANEFYHRLRFVKIKVIPATGKKRALNQWELMK